MANGPRGRGASVSGHRYRDVAAGDVPRRTFGEAARGRGHEAAFVDRLSGTSYRPSPGRRAVLGHGAGWLFGGRRRRDGPHPSWSGAGRARGGGVASGGGALHRDLMPMARRGARWLWHLPLVAAVDQFLLPVLGHRSVVTHSVLLPVLVLALAPAVLARLPGRWRPGPEART